MTKSIAKIYKGDSDEVIGVGFYVFPGVLLTCAHVVNQSLGFKQGDRMQPEGFVEMEFPNSATRRRVKGRVLQWYPADSGQREDDIAVLELSEPLPDNVMPMSLVMPTRVPLVTKGYPNNYDDRWGVSTALTIAPGEVLNDLIQLENPNQRIAPGFSGAPVWDESSGCAVGMIVLSQADDGVAWMISASVLRSVLETPEMLKHLVERIELGDFSFQAAIDLIQILKGFDDFSLVWDIAYGVLPIDIKTDRADLIQCFEQEQFSNFEKSFKLVKFLVQGKKVESL